MYGLKQPALLLVDGLATWRLSNLLVNEDGPNKICAKLRKATGIEYWTGSSGEVMHAPDWNPLVCTYCTSIWVSLVLFFAPRWLKDILAVSAAAILVDNVNGSITN